MMTSTLNSLPEHETLTFKIAASDSGVRLDAFLAGHIPNWSRSRLQKLIEEGDVVVNGASTRASYKLRAADEIEVELTPSPTEPFAPENIPVSVVYEDDQIIVVDKPAGLVVHPAAGIQTGTLANALAYHFQQLSSKGGPARPGIVHRLDRDTSGLLVVAKTEIAHENLSNQFRARQVFKSYLALIHGSLPADTGRIEQPITRDPANRTRMAVVANGRPALSLYRVRQRYHRFTLLDVELKTGRTHQIRVHLAWLKHPVVGDEIYGGGRDKTVVNVKLRAEIRKLHRQFLHAEQLAFDHPLTDERLHFNSPLPAELKNFLDLLAAEL